MTIDNFKSIVKAEYPNAKISWRYLNGNPSSYVANVLTERKLRHTVTVQTLKAKGLV